MWTNMWKINIMVYTKISSTIHKTVLQDELLKNKVISQRTYIRKLAMDKSTLKISVYHLAPYHVRSNNISNLFLYSNSFRNFINTFIVSFYVMNKLIYFVITNLTWAHWSSSNSVQKISISYDRIIKYM